jgi:hypothetical protein
MTLVSNSLPMMPPAIVPSVTVTPGFNALTRILRPPSSFESDIDMESMALFVAQYTEPLAIDILPAVEPILMIDPPPRKSGRDSLTERRRPRTFKLKRRWNSSAVIYSIGLKL